MSKTETQSDAPINKLREAFEFELIDNHAYTAPDLEKKDGCYADDEIQFAWEMAVFAWGFTHGAASVEVRRLDAENKALRARLEIDPSHPIDGIAARDETIKLLEEQVKRLRDVLEAVEMDVVYVGGGENAISDTVIDKVDVVLQQVRFQQAGSSQAAAKTGDAA